MKVFSISILLQKKPADKPMILCGEQDVSDWSFFTRGSIKDFMVFTTRTVFQKVKDPKASIQEKEYMCHVLKTKAGLGCVIIADAEYKQMLAHCLMQELLTKFKGQFDLSKVENRARCMKDHMFDKDFPQLHKLLVDCQDPTKVDKVLKIHAQIDQTKAVMYKTIDSLLDRGCKLDDLVHRSDDLTARSKAFYDTAKSTNACPWCVIS